jgi:hypothetical protein
MAVLLIQKHPHEDGQNDANNGNGVVLSGQISRRTRLNGRCNFLHPRIARVLGQNPTTCPNAVNDGDDPQTSAKINAELPVINQSP